MIQTHDGKYWHRGYLPTNSGVYELAWHHPYRIYARYNAVDKTWGTPTSNPAQAQLISGTWSSSAAPDKIIWRQLIKESELANNHSSANPCWMGWSSAIAPLTCDLETFRDMWNNSSLNAVPTPTYVEDVVVHKKSYKWVLRKGKVERDVTI